MTDRFKVYPAGTILIMTEGSYSDYGICGQLVTLTECDMPALAKDFNALRPTKDDPFYSDYGPSDFCAWLVATQKCAPLECEELHLGEHYNRVRL